VNDTVVASAHGAENRTVAGPLIAVHETVSESFSASVA
jgi:hypothetical protein